MQEFIQIMNYTVLNTPLYKFAIAFGIFFFFLIAKKFFSLSIIKSVEFFVGKTKTDIDDNILKALIDPLNTLFLLFGIYFGAMSIDLHKLLSPFLKAAFTFLFFWILFNLIKSFEGDILALFGKRISKEISLFFVKALKIFVLALGLVAVLQTFGINVSAFIASLGLGGLAFALAAKDTAANLFGGFAILTDNIFKIGDWIKIGSVEGIVEDIGMRTTKIRAFDKRLIVVPNATIANSAVDNFSRRDRRRIKMRIGLTYSTSTQTMQKILREIREMLQNHPQIHKEPLFVYFDEFGASSLDLFFYLFTKTAVWEEYLQIREDINLKIIEIVQKNGSDFAFPSQSIYFENELEITR
ncbi:Potassium efflux system KefA protein / Small-conductance mechanosensitive channel [hydrothermal vent metagenome]|uniref:Potassium efflux system KefA protein / Small-conductance mechanosensitive channel n=1 Tax=hydrothermal vent metagenome TaxID=652676 RepID=A0A1W1BE49_9ZZZZ